MAKPFNKLQNGDYIYQLNPFNLKVEGMRVKDVMGVTEELIRGGHPNAEMYKHYVKIIYYRREIVFHSQDLENVPTVTLIVDGRVTNVIAQVKLVADQNILYPVPFTTDEKSLKEWMNATK